MNTPSTPFARLVVRFSGHVQGVGFRVTAIQQARGIPVHGFVRNRSDGSVEMDIEGAPSDVNEVVRRIDHVMRLKIDATEIRDEPPLGRSDGFRIRQ